MKQLLTFFVLFFFSELAWTQPVSCQGVGPKLSQAVEKIKRNYQRRDVAAEVGAIKTLANYCKINTRQLGFGSENLNFWENGGYQAEFTKSKERIEHYAKYRDVGPEIQKYLAYSNKLGHSNSYVKNFAAKQRELGLKAAQLEKNRCQPAIDLRSPVLGKVRDQDSVGWCGAFAGADLLTFNFGKKVSAADLALKNNDSWLKNLLKKGGRGEQDFNGVFANQAIEASTGQGGACLESDIRSEDNGYASLHATLSRMDNSKRLESGDARLAMNSCVAAAKSMFPHLALRDIQAIAQATAREDLVEKLSQKACKQRLPTEGLKIESHSAEGPNRRQLFDHIDAQLAKKNPSSVAYNSNILFNVNHDGPNAPHESVVVGRRFNNTKGECEYLVRNSWGRGCHSYDRSLSCEEGNLWVPKSVLVKGLYHVTYIK